MSIMWIMWLIGVILGLILGMWVSREEVREIIDSLRKESGEE